MEALADRKALAPEQASVLRMLAWCRDFALLQLYEQVSCVLPVPTLSHI